VGIAVNPVTDLGAEAIVVTINPTEYINRDDKNHIIQNVRVTITQIVVIVVRWRIIRIEIDVRLAIIIDVTIIDRIIAITESLLTDSLKAHLKVYVALSLTKSAFSTDRISYPRFPIIRGSRTSRVPMARLRS
jgi:hypothetical protein